MVLSNWLMTPCTALKPVAETGSNFSIQKTLKSPPQLLSKLPMTKQPNKTKANSTKSILPALQSDIRQTAITLYWMVQGG
jgi:hypothetical protein